MVTGVSIGFEKKLLLVGVGYTAEKKGDLLLINVGFLTLSIFKYQMV